MPVHYYHKTKIHVTFCVRNLRMPCGHTLSFVLDPSVHVLDIKGYVISSSVTNLKNSMRRGSGSKRGRLKQYKQNTLV